MGNSVDYIVELKNEISVFLDEKPHIESIELSKDIDTFIHTLMITYVKRQDLFNKYVETFIHSNDCIYCN